MVRKAKLMAAISIAAAGVVLGPRAVKAYDSWQMTRKQAWMEQAKAAIASGSEQLSPIPWGVTLVEDPDEVRGEEKDDPAMRELQQLMLFGSRTPEYQHELMRIAQQESAKDAAIKAALREDPNNVLLAPVASTIVANSVGPAGARSEYNGTYYPGQDSGRIRSIRVHPANANTVYVATTGGGVWKTTNFHTSAPDWVPLTDNVIASIDLGAMDIDPTGNLLVVGTGEHGDALPGGSFMKSTDGGATWQTPVLLTGNYVGTPANFTVTAVQVRSMVIDPTNTSVIMAGTDVGLFRSTDGGTTWTVIDLPNPAAYVFRPGYSYGLEGIHDIVYLGAGTDGATQWMASGDYACPGTTATSTTLPILRGSHSATCSIGASAPGNLGDVWKSVDGGLTWSSMRVAGKLPTQDPTWGTTPDTTASNGTRLPDVGRIGLASAPNADPSLASVYANAASVSDASAQTVLIFGTRNGGTSWNKLATSRSTNLLNPTKTSDCNNMNVGHNQSWYNIAIAVDPQMPDRAITGGNLCSYRTLDGGATWSVVSHWLPTSTSGRGYTADGNGPLPYAHADWHTATISRVGGRFVVLAGTDGGIFASYNVFESSPANLTTWAQPNYGLVTMLPYGHGTGDPVLGNGQVLWIGLQDNGTRWRLSHTENIAIITLRNWDQVIGGDGTGNAAASDMNGQNQVYWAGLPGGPRNYCRPAVRDCSRATQIVDGTEFLNWFRVTNTQIPSGDGDPFTLRFSPTYDEKSSVITASTFNAWKMSVDSNDNVTITRLTPTGFPSGRNTQLQHVYASPWRYQINGVTSRVYGVVQTGGRFLHLIDTGTGTPAQSVSGQMTFNGTAVTGSSTLAYPRVPENLGAPAGTPPTMAFIAATTAVTPAEMGKLFKTYDNGTTWIPIHGNGTPAPSGTGTLDLPNVPIYVVRIDYGDPTEKTFYVGTELGLYRTTDGGDTWARYGNVPTARIIDLSVSLNGSLVRATAYGRGVWEMYPHSEPGSTAGDGDWDKNGVVDFRDVIAAAGRIGKTPALNTNDPNSFPNYYEPRFDAALDTNTDGKVDDADLTTVLTKFGGTP